MNNNRNNRRRGRGNRPQGGNGNQLNRIDSRARGNAPQMLEKYKKLAQDAHHNGDRVQMEQYLQFADHYFRVIADNKVRQDETRGPRRNDDRDQAEEYGDDDLDFDRGRRNEQSSRTRYEQQDNDSRGDQAEGEQGQEGESSASDDRGNDRSDDRGGQPQRQQSARRQPRKAREDNRGERPERAPRAERSERAERPERSEAPRTEKRAEKAADKPDAKPAPRARKPRKPADDSRANEQGGIDSSILPPSIRSDDSDSKAGNGSGDSDGTLEAVG
ncbi:DUF4167 domain-containing protein [Erythrobacter sp.]|uniref:DUF4167 domain-containing protein n=1 Tax=Erythrobacter sp. TaxID=1042 RepID=UPI0025F3829E|nr:DUF4167 domain-containing protein [Erythrobacter sp.]